MAAEMENLMDVYRCLVPDDDDFVNSVVMEYLLPELPASKLIEESDTYLRRQGLKASPLKEKPSINPNQSKVMTTESQPKQDPISSSITITSSTCNLASDLSIPMAVTLIPSIVKSEVRRREQQDEEEPTEQRELKRTKFDENDIEIFAKVVDILCQSLSQKSMNPSPRSPLQITRSPFPKVSEVVTVGEMNRDNSNTFVCKTCGERTSNRVCIWNRMGILLGPYTASALKYLNNINENFTPETLFEHQSSNKVEVNLNEIEVPSVAHMKNLEDNLRVAMIYRLKLIQEQASPI